jgi:hypothetical protein
VSLRKALRVELGRLLGGLLATVVGFALGKALRKGEGMILGSLLEERLGFTLGSTLGIDDGPSLGFCRHLVCHLDYRLALCLEMHEKEKTESYLVDD